MRRALATVTIAGAVALVPFTAASASADESGTASGTVLSQSDVDVDEPLAEDGNDDTGKYGLIGLSGLLGLFGYKKYQEHRAAQTTGTAGANDTPGTSRRI